MIYLLTAIGLLPGGSNTVHSTQFEWLLWGSKSTLMSCAIRGSHSGTAVDSSLLGYYAVSTGNDATSQKDWVCSIFPKTL